MFIAAASAAPRPILRIKHQLCLGRIVFNVLKRLSLVLGIAHVNVEVIFRPEGTPLAEQFVRKPSCVLLPPAHNLRHRNRPNFEQNVDMIWHDHPSAQLVASRLLGTAGLRAAAFPRKLPEIILNQFGDFRMTKVTIATPSVQVCFNQFAPLAVIFNPRKMLPFGTKPSRKTIGEMKGDELRQTRFVAMR